MLRTSLRGGACSAIALSAFFAFSPVGPAAADSFSVPTDPGNSPKTLTGTQTGTVESGATLSLSGVAVTWQGPSTDVILNNHGTIESTGGRAIDTDNSGGNVPRTITVNNFDGATISAADDTFRIRKPLGDGTVTVNNSGTFTSSTGQVFDFAGSTSATGTVNIYNEATGTIRALDNDAIRPGLGTILVENSGLIQAAERAINIAEGDLNNLKSFKVYNYEGGEITGLADDAIRIGTDEDDPVSVASAATTQAHILIDNAGKITATGGQAIDLDDIASSHATIDIINRATGVITATGADAIRPGEGATVTNYGKIYAGGVIGSGESSDAVDLQGHKATINNMTGGEISGFRHGITTDVDVTVNNWGTITGRNGSGVGSDGDGTVTNYGRITGAYDGSGTGDGDGVDIDFNGTVKNYGIIEGTGAAGLKDGFPNHAEGIAMGGGTIINYAGALISGADTGILIDNGEEGSAYAAVSITNAGTITGLAGDAIIVVGDHADTLINSGTINGSVDLGGGANTFENQAGGRLNAGALLAAGTGNTLLNAGTIAPGGDGVITTTALTGKLDQTSTGSLAIDLNAATKTADRLDVSQTAALAGSIRLSVTDIAIASGSVTVLTAAEGATPTDLNLIASPALQARLVYPNANEVQVAYAVNFAPTAAGLNGNQSSMGGYLNNAVTADSTSLTGVTSALLNVTSNGAYTGALDQLSPEVYGDAAVSTLYGARTFGNALLSCHPRDGAYAAVREGECVWADVSGRDYQQDAGIGYDEQTWSVSGGGQVKVGKDVVLGFAGGFEQGSGDTNSGASVDTDRVYGGVTLKHTSGPWLLAAAVYGGRGWSDVSRPVNFGGLAMVADGEQDVEHLSGRVRAAYQAGSNAFYAKPMVDLEATQLWLGSVHETGGPAALSVASSDETVFSAAPALEIGGERALAGGILVRPFARIGALFSSNDELTVSSTFAGGPAGIPGFQTQAELDRVMGTVGAGLDLVWSDSSTLKLHYDGMFGDDTQQHAFGAKASFKF